MLIKNYIVEQWKFCHYVEEFDYIDFNLQWDFDVLLDFQMKIMVYFNMSTLKVQYIISLQSEIGTYPSNVILGMNEAGCAPAEYSSGMFLLNKETDDSIQWIKWITCHNTSILRGLWIRCTSNIQTLTYTETSINWYPCMFLRLSSSLLNQ